GTDRPPARRAPQDPPRCGAARRRGGAGGRPGGGPYHPRSRGAPPPPADPLDELLRLGDRLLDRPDHVEGLLGQLVVLALEDLLEDADRVGEAQVDDLRAGEMLRYVEGLRQRALKL